MFFFFFLIIWSLNDPSSGISFTQRWCRIPSSFNRPGTFRPVPQLMLRWIALPRRGDGEAFGALRDDRDWHRPASGDPKPHREIPGRLVLGAQGGGAVRKVIRTTKHRVVAPLFGSSDVT